MRGGARQGAGRPKGVRNRVTTEVLAKASKGGDLPLDVMLGNMRLADKRAKKLFAMAALAKSNRQRRPLLDEAFRMQAIAQNAARDAAPYVHSKLPTLQPANPAGAGSIDTEITIRFVGGADPKVIEGFDQPRKIAPSPVGGFDRGRLSLIEGKRD